MLGPKTCGVVAQRFSHSPLCPTDTEQQGELPPDLFKKLLVCEHYEHKNP